MATTHGEGGVMEGVVSAPDLLVSEPSTRIAAEPRSLAAIQHGQEIVFE